MDTRFRTIAAIAAAQHSVVSSTQLDQQAVGPSLRQHWRDRGLLRRVGTRSWAIGGAEPTWHQSLQASVFDLQGAAFLAGRASARLHGLDGFPAEAIELLGPRDLRRHVINGRLATTRLPITRQHVITRFGLPCLTAEATILTSPLFGFSVAETHNAIDSAIRLRLASEQRLRTAVIAAHRRSTNGGRVLLDALVDTGGESHLERLMLKLLRQAGIPRPDTQRTFRSNGRTVARVDLIFPCGLVVEVSGHGTHSSRSARQTDSQRRTELTLRGLRVLDFTYDDVRHRPAWVVNQIRLALRLAA